jgi:hypothetical protein
MMLFKPFTIALPFILAIYIPTCAKPVRPTVQPKDVKMDELWREPTDLASRDLFYGQGGKNRAPDPKVVYTFKERKQTGTNPGVTVTDPEGREWHVKQPPVKPKLLAKGAEGPVEVTLSRIFWAVGYHQPPEYFLPEFTMVDETKAEHKEPGGRFRLDDNKHLKKIGDWSWQENPFVGTRPYQGLLVILMLFNSSDIKNENNTLYEIPKPADGDPKLWYVVRDLGTSLGETAKLYPKRGDPDLFEQHGFVLAVKDGFVRFDYKGWHQELVRDRITPGDVRWGCELLSRLSDAQWADAFRAGGWEPQLAQRFIKRVQQKIRQGMQLEGTATARVVTPLAASEPLLDPVAAR